MQPRPYTQRQTMGIDFAKKKNVLRIKKNPIQKESYNRGFNKTLAI